MKYTLIAAANAVLVLQTGYHDSKCSDVPTSIYSFDVADPAVQNPGANVYWPEFYHYWGPFYPNR